MAARTGKAKLAGVIGNPVGHSLSPALHEYWLRQYQIDGAYIPLEVPDQHLAQTLEMLDALHFQGVNITIPYKEEAYALLAQTDSCARLCGAVNTLIRQEGGGFLGKNTDVEGFTENLRAQGVPLETLEHACILGAGGAARAAIVGLAQSGCKRITITNRTQAKAETLARQLSDAGLEASLKVLHWEMRQNALDSADLLVNTTQLGMKGQAKLEIDLRALAAHATVYDIVYNPLETELLQQAKKLGLKSVTGLGMLLYQAVPGFESWFGVRPEVTPELTEYMISLVGT